MSMERGTPILFMFNNYTDNLFHMKLTKTGRYKINQSSSHLRGPRK